MPRRFRSYLICGAALTAIAIAYFAWMWHLNSSLRGMLAGCNRLVVQAAVRNPDTGAVSSQALDVRGPDTVAELVAALRLWPRPLVRCRCKGGPRISFFRDDTEVTTLALAHGQSIKWSDGEYPLDGSSREAVRQWVHKQGYDLAGDDSGMLVSSPLETAR